MSRRQSLPTTRPRERVLTCGVLFGEEREQMASATTLDELRGLLLAAGADPVGEGIVQRRERPVAGTLMGSGKVAEVRHAIERLRPDAVAVDNDLSPAQIRNLEKAWGVRVLDRSEVILDIFATRARTRQARLQVELAQAEYLLPRLRRMWTHLERTEGAIGTRGPGETQLETDRRLLRTRVRDLRRELAQIEARRQREVRSRSDQFSVGLVGYTNAGKSTLLNRLTGANELAVDMLFSTLDTRTRQWRLPDGRTVLLSDTVGFLQRLPHHLVASFHATLEETLHADLLLHVIDASHPECEQQMAAVNEVLHGLSWSTRADVLVFNKIDRVEEPLRLHTLALDRSQDVVFVSAATGEGLERLTAVVSARLDARSALVDVFVPLADGKSLAAVRRVGALVEQQVLGAEFMRMRLRISEEALGNLRHDVASSVLFERVEDPIDGGDAGDASAGETEDDAERAVQ